MLRVIFGVTGAGFVALGLFGGQIFENLQGGLTSGSNSSASVATSESVARNVVSSIDSATSLDSTASVVSDATEQQPQTNSDADVVGAGLESTGVLVAKAVSEPQLAPADVNLPDGNLVEEVPAIHSDAGTELETTQQNTGSPSTTLASAVVPVVNGASDSTQQAEPAESILASTQATSSEPSVEVVSAQSKQEELGEVLETTTGQISSEEILVVVKDKVNMRDGPSIDFPIVLELGLGQELMEFKREGRWVQVGAYGTSGKIGWVHHRLVGPAE